MKILLVHNFYTYKGGEDVYFLSLQKMLRNHGHKVYAFTKNNNSIKTPLDKLKTSFFLFHNSKSEKDFHNILEKIKPDIVHFNNTFPLLGMGLYKICKNRGIKVIQTVNNYRLICPGAFMYSNSNLCIHKKKNANFFAKVFSKCYRNSRYQTAVIMLSIYFHRLLNSLNNIDVFIFPSEFAKKIHINNLKIQEKHTTVIPYFIDFPAKTKSKPDRNYFLFVGRLSEEKGVIDLLKLAITLIHINFIFIGDGNLKERVDSYKKYENITILPFLDKRKIYEYMQNAIATIIPSKGYETGPIVAIESAINNTKVIAPNLGTFRDLSRSIKCITYTPKSITSLKRKILDVYKIKNNSLNLSSEEKNKYSSSYHYTKLLRIYQDNTLFKNISE